MPGLPIDASLTKLKESVGRWPLLAQWLQGPADCIGLDIGSTSVKGVLVSRTPGGFKLIRCALKPLAPAASGPQRTEAIQEVFKVVKSREARVVTALGGAGAVVRSIVLPEMSAQELKAALSFEAEKYIPFKVTEAFFDSVILGKRPPGRMEVLLAAARKELVQAHLQMLSSMNLVPDVIDVEALALVNAWEVARPAGASGVIGLIHIGARGTILVFFNGSQMQFTREIPVGGDVFTQAIAQGLQIDPAKAEAIKCRPGDRLPDVRAAVQTSWEDWLSQSRVSFDFYENQFGSRVERIYLSGGSARLVDLQEKVKEAMGLPIEEWNPLTALASDLDTQQMKSSGPALAIALGLAVRGAAG